MSDGPGAEASPHDLNVDGGFETTDAAEEAVVSDIDQLSAERDELLVVAQRLQADFENYKKRMLRDQTIAIERANERLLESLLPTLDSFEMAMRSYEDSEEDTVKVRDGVVAAIRQLFDSVTKAGLEKIEALGTEFDPTEHEAVMHEEGDGEAVVVSVFRTGYRLKGRVVRPAMVKVGPQERTEV